MSPANEENAQRYCDEKFAELAGNSYLGQEFNKIRILIFVQTDI